MSIHQKLLRIADAPTVKGIRPMVKKDVKEMRKLLTDFLSTKEVVFTYTNQEVEHFFMPKAGVMYTYVIEDEESKKITDFFSFYSLPSSVLKHERHKSINAVFSFYNTSLNHTPTQIMENSVIFAKKEGFDVMNCLDILDNNEFLEDCKFRRGSGSLYYYLYNFALNNKQPNEIGIVLV